MAVYYGNNDWRDYHLAHHGILGQKWGIRRYQNPDGTLTSLGRKRYRKAFDSMVVGTYPSYDYRTTPDEYIVKTADKTGVIPKGTKAYRVANPGDVVDANRKYVTFTKDGLYEYENLWTEGALDGDFGGARDSITYKTIKDLNVATSEQVKDYIASKQLDKIAYSTILSDVEYFKKYTNSHELRDPRKRIEKRALNYLDEGENYLNKSYQKALSSKYDENNSTFKYFEVLGYDAISDVEDGGLSGGLAAAIILNPSKSLKEMERKHNN